MFCTLYGSTVSVPELQQSHRGFREFVLNEAKNLYEKLLEDSIDKTISNVPNDISPNVQSSSVLHRTEPFDIKNNPLQRK